MACNSGAGPGKAPFPDSDPTSGPQIVFPPGSSLSAQSGSTPPWNQTFPPPLGLPRVPPCTAAGFSTAETLFKQYLAQSRNSSDMVRSS